MSELSGTSGFLKTEGVGDTYFKYMKALSVLGYSWLIVNGIYILIVGTSEGVSMVGMGLYFSVSLSFLCYGLLRNDIVIVTGSMVALISNLFVLICIFIVISNTDD